MIRKVEMIDRSSNDIFKFTGFEGGVVFQSVDIDVLTRGSTRTQYI
jgi:hypothetical protein